MIIAFNRRVVKEGGGFSHRMGLFVLGFLWMATKAQRARRRGLAAGGSEVETWIFWAPF